MTHVAHSHLILLRANGHSIEVSLLLQSLKECIQASNLRRILEGRRRRTLQSVGFKVLSAHRSAVNSTLSKMEYKSVLAELSFIAFMLNESLWVNRGW